MINENYLNILKGKYVLNEIWKDKIYGKITEDDYNDIRSDVFYCLTNELYSYLRIIYKKYLNKKNNI